MRWKTIAAAVLTLALFGAALPAFAGKQIDGVDAEEFRFGSMAIGQAKDLDYARAEGLGLVPASPLDTYLNGILAKLLAQSPVRGVPASVHLRASGDWAARTTADANIYVTLGTLLRLDDEDEIAALLAHETAHVILGHADADVVTDLQRRAVQLSALAGEAQEDLPGEAPPKPDLPEPPGPDARVAAQDRILELNTMILVPAWTRGQEQDADLLGIDLLVRAGYAPQAMTSLLRKQQKVEAERAADRKLTGLDEELFGVALNEEVRGSTERAAEAIGLEDPGLGEIAGGAVGKVFQWGAKKVDDVKRGVSRSHPKTEERVEVAEKYIKRQYPSGETRAPRADAWDAAKDADGTADLLDNYIAAIQARDKLGEGDLVAARRLSKASLTAPTQAHAYPNYVDAALDRAIGGAAASGLAFAAYDNALAGPEPAGAIYSEASALYLETGNKEKAVEVIEVGYRRLQQPPSLTLPLIRTYRAAGRQADAERIAAECAARWPKLQSLCSQEAKSAARVSGVDSGGAQETP